MSQLKALHRLQKIDQDLDARRQRVRDIAVRLEQDDVLRQAQADVAALQSALHPPETRTADLNLEIQTIASQTGQLTNRLYSGKVNNPKELQDIQDKIAELKRRHAHLENTLLETMIAIEELQSSLSAATEHLAQVEAAWAAEQTKLTDEQQHLKREIKTLKTEREETTQQVSQEYLDLYQTLRTTKQGCAVATLEGEMCSRCRVGQTTTIVQRIRQGQELILCANCGRILVAL